MLYLISRVKELLEIPVKKKMIVLLTKIDGVRAIHFTKQPLAGPNHCLWFPIENQELHSAITKILITTNQAYRVSLVRLIREINYDSRDYEIVYHVDEN